MELFFLAVLFGLMVWALTSGFPVAFALPGSAIIAVGLAAASGYIFAGDPTAYFAQDGASQWLSAGVTNFRSLYWIVERDTLIAIPLFIFMGVMLQRSKIAEDLLIAMAQLFGPLPGGLGISVVFVGTLLAATTGIVGATVIAMGLISLPAMLKNNYSKPLATGIICASGTLGQIIPPSIVLIILADQLSSAADQANTMRQELYRSATGEYSMPSHFDVVSASAGDMFMGALIPGLILVSLYIAYIIIVALVKPKMAPPVPYEGSYDRKFALNIFLALVPPLALIFVVLGSILLGVATVNQAGSIGAIGAMIMAGYRLHEGSKNTKYIPIIIALISLAFIGYFTSNYDLNIKNITSDAQVTHIKLTAIAVSFLLFAVAWSAIRVYKINNTLREVMIETSKTTSMVFIILLGAAMLTAAFRGFGGEELVKHFLTTLPGGFWTQFIVVMLVIFILGFFLDFIEIAVVVVPIVAPILLSNPEANVTAVWFGVMIGLNMQTSFLTPPFGFALFYLRGVADKIVKTMDIYKGATAFIILQLIGLSIVGFFPALVNYLPNRIHLLSETAPPPLNPKLQLCLEEYTMDQYASTSEQIDAGIEKAKTFNISALPEKLQADFNESINNAKKGLSLVATVKSSKKALEDYVEGYKPLQKQVLYINSNLKNVISKMKLTETKRQRASNSTLAAKFESELESLQAEKKALEDTIPQEWDSRHKEYKALDMQLTKNRREYFNAVDSSTETLHDLEQTIADSDKLSALSDQLNSLDAIIMNADLSNKSKNAIAKIKKIEAEFSSVKNANSIQSKISKARRKLKKAKNDEAKDKAIAYIKQAKEAFEIETKWRNQAKIQLLTDLKHYDETLSKTIGLRLQEHLTKDQALGVASCMSHHKDLSLSF